MGAKIEAGNHGGPKRPNCSYPRVIEVIRGLGMGGAEILLAVRLAHHETDECIGNAEVISTSPIRSHYADQLSDAGVKLTVTKSNSPIRSGLQLAILCLRDRGPRIYVVHSPGPLFFLKLLRFFGLIRSPLVQVVHSAKYRTAYRVLNRLTNWLSAGGIAVSEEVRASAGCIGLRNRVTVYGGIDTNEMARFVRATPCHRHYFRSELQIPSGTPLLACVGRLVARKGHADLIRALNQSSSPAHLAIVGDGPEMNNLKKLTSMLKMSDRVHFVGQYAPGWHWILASDGLCHTSHAGEGLPVVVMEALALGVPILATDFSGAIEASGKSPGLVTIVPTGDLAAISEGIDQMSFCTLLERDRLRVLATTYWTVDRYKREFTQAVVSFMDGVERP